MIIKMISNKNDNENYKHKMRTKRKHHQILSLKIITLERMISEIIIKN
jgi:hypothetical protein